MLRQSANIAERASPSLAHIVYIFFNIIINVKMNINAQQAILNAYITNKSSLFKIYSANVSTSSELYNDELQGVSIYTRLSNNVIIVIIVIVINVIIVMYAFRIACWALIFIFRLHFPPATSIAIIINDYLPMNLAQYTDYT